MEVSFAQRYFFKFLVFTSLIAGLIFFYTNHIDFISVAMKYNKMNIPNIAYALLRIFGGIFIPVIFIVPSLFEYGRVKLARICFIAYGVCHLLTLSWIVYFVLGRSFIDIFSISKITEFMKDGGFVYHITFWDTYGLSASFFSIIYGFAAIYAGLILDKDKNVAKAAICILFTLRIALPLLTNMVSHGMIFSLFWVTNNVWEIVSQLLFTAAILFAGSSNYAWIEFVWDQPVFVESDDIE